jgi:N-glycosidase YbiA
MAIKGFFGENRFLSNFWFSKVWYEGLEYPSVEHAYQAAKSLNQGERATIASLRKPGDAKRAGNGIKLRPDWEQVKVDIMTYLVKEKFKTNSSLRKQLLATGDQYLEETNTWNDTFWGVCNGKGQNWLGKILMSVRKELQQG